MFAVAGQGTDAMTTESDPAGTLEVAMKRASELLGVDVSLAAAQAQEILKAVPEYPPAILLLASANRQSGDPAAAMGILETLVKRQDVWAAAHFEHGLTLAALGRGDEAIDALKRTVELKPGYPDAWRLLADHFMATGDLKAGDAAYARHIQNSTKDPLLQQAAAAMVKNEIPKAEQLLKSHLKQSPTDVPAIRMLAEVAVRCGRDEEALKLLRRCLELAPGFAAARYNYATLLHRHNDSAAALVEIERLLESDPDSPSYRNLCAVILSRVGEYERSSKIYKQLLDEYPANAKVWLSYGHVLKTEGRQETCIDAYRQSLERDPSFGEAYWSLANLKTYRFTDADLSAMETQLADPKLDDENRWHFHFALGKACEDAKDYARSFEQYAKGNALYRAENGYNADLNLSRTEQLKKSFSHDLFSARSGSGCDAPDPIFIVGMPRSGSTLLEQILSCHSAVEGTTELPDMISMAMDLREQAASDDIAVYADVLAAKSDDELREIEVLRP